MASIGISIEPNPKKREEKGVDAKPSDQTNGRDAFIRRADPLHRHILWLHHPSEPSKLAKERSYGAVRARTGIETAWEESGEGVVQEAGEGCGGGVVGLFSGDELVDAFADSGLE